MAAVVVRRTEVFLPGVDQNDLREVVVVDGGVHLALGGDDVAG
ncbi:hypothetical protein SDC9_164422 [bioreactor metagenome]|uniref:Uncharacterized protein n=1 Tax=bioreactor metagenome TaxID=1076179 RepID=A0A645FTU8_9ZZZZ